MSYPRDYVLTKTFELTIIKRAFLTFKKVLLLIDLPKRIQGIIKPEIERIKKEQDGK